MGIFDGLFSKKSKVENSISEHDALMRAVENVMKKNFKGQNFSFSQKVLRLWVTDNLRYESLNTSNFVNDLRYRLDSQIGLNFSSIELHLGKLPQVHDFTELDACVFMEICSIIESADVRKAEITALPNYGSLMVEKYLLDSEDISHLPSQRYNIGAGEYPDLNGRLRCNHIAVDDDVHSPGFERNKYVSRTHAYIRFSSTCGFMLQAEAEGTAKAGMRTRILRGEEIIEVDDLVPQPLKNGDCIELNKNVRLMFKVVR